jgi:hypothetical protein
MSQLARPRLRRWLLPAAAVLVVSGLVVGVKVATTGTDPTTAPAPAAGAARPLGGGLNGEVDYTKDFAFVDAMKTAGQFRTLDSDGGIDFKHDAPVDARGFPTTDFGVLVNETQPPLGTYRLSFTTAHQPQVRLDLHPGKVQNLAWNAATGRGTADVVLTAPGNEHTGLAFTGTGGGARDIRLIRPGYDPAKAPTFSNEYLAHLRNLNPTVVRFMDWAQTNRNVVSTWSERTLTTDARQTATLTRKVPSSDNVAGHTESLTQEKGIAWEYAIELANTIGADAWINLPALADDDYVTNLARLVHSTLRSDLRVWVEYSNELWNGGFEQQHWNLAAAQAKSLDSTLNDDGEADAWMRGQRLAAKRTVEIADIFAREFGSGAGRIRPVLANQFDNPFLVEDQLKFIKRKFGAPSSHLYAIATAPYIYMHEADDTSTNLSTTDVINALSKGVDTIEKEGNLKEWNTLATDNGLKMAAYEGGPDTFGPNNITAKRNATMDPRMRQLCERYLRLWYANGGDQFNWFTLGADSYESESGTWSLTNDINNLNSPKMQAFRTIRQDG